MLPNTGKLAGCTLFITGASRGIGKAIALKAAKDGANIVIAAKTTQAHPKLPGTIYTAAEEIEAAGGKALPCVVDVRDEQQISDAVEKAVQKFGAYTIAKYGMSMCVLGMAEEFKGEIAVNALWPKTAIHTAAMDMLGGSGVESQCRKADIIADAAYSIFSKPKSFTGNFIIDENLLKEEGIKNFDVYAVKPGHPLLPDFFVDEYPETISKEVEKQQAPPAKDWKQYLQQPRLAAGAVEETFKILKTALSEDIVKATQAVYLFELSGEDGGTWYLDLKNNGGYAGSGQPSDQVDVVMTMTTSDFVKMFSGKLKPTMAFMSGKLKIKGNMALAIKLERLMTQMNSRL
ncbi:hydroxysteroid dehydrogenase-like protein 2 isoform X3 [Gracilinanus agilis]|uniref:hydroxysteroid dehydrogenase-like protein 2 isoform X3 n=1 Tax=Gracilinanus agilis TaxID=191870 RepID=UPI001CFE38A4|nr:hydroxysteroid dehydrogenase-like protein 2 isoform X3 [Gracilinanus agilis]